MSTITMSIHRALVELKTLTNRIDRATKETFVTFTQGDKAPARYPSLETFQKEAVSALDSVQTLIERRKKIKAAIIASNASTEVKIAGVKMTVAEAIDRRDTGIQYDKNLLMQLRHQLNTVERAIELAEAELRNRADKHIEASYGNAEKVDATEVSNAREDFMKRYEVKIQDPANIRQHIRDLEKSIEDFEAEVDFTLSESNTQTQIEV